MRGELLKSIGIFVVFNLIYGMKAGVDNAAHVGGLVSGFVFGYLYVFAMKQEKATGNKMQWVVPVILVLTAGSAYGYISSNYVDIKDREILLSQAQDDDYKDNEKFGKKMEEFDVLNDAATNVLMDSTLTDEKLIRDIDEKGMPNLVKAEQLITIADGYEISPALHAKAKLLKEFVTLRKREFEILREIAVTKDYETHTQKLNDVREAQGKVIEEINK